MKPSALPKAETAKSEAIHNELQLRKHRRTMGYDIPCPTCGKELNKNYDTFIDSSGTEFCDAMCFKL